MVTIPTIDQISGTTVMNKMRSLIHAFINFATGIDDEITEFENTVTQDFYTKLEVDTKFADYYTKSQIDSGWYTKFEIQNEVLVDYYTKTQIDTTFASYYTKTETDTLLDDKQDVLTAGSNITIENNVISATGGGSGEWVISQEVDCRPFINSDRIFTKDVRIVIATYLPSKPNNIGLIKAEHIFHKGDVLVDDYSKINFEIYTRPSSSGDSQYGFLAIQGLMLTTYSDSYSYFRPNVVYSTLTNKTSYYELSINESVDITVYYNKSTTTISQGSNFMVVFTND